jgi:serine/threonine-protein kinase PknK
VNVFVDDYREPQLADFGTGDIAGAYRTANGSFNGTMVYLAPEVLEGFPQTFAADVYSLGATLHDLITERRHGEPTTDEEFVALYRRLISTPLPDLRPTGTPDDVCAVLYKSTLQDPAERYATAEEFGRALQSVQRSNGLAEDAMALASES